MKIIISPYSRKLREKETPHPKNYPYWKELIDLMRKGVTLYQSESEKRKAEGTHLEGTSGYVYPEIIQIGVDGEEKLVENCQFGLCSKDLIDLCNTMDAFISVENFFPHFVHHNFKDKRGIVLFGKSDPEIFGYPENINLLKDQKYLRWDQFGPWEACEFQKEAFVEPPGVMEALKKIRK